MPAPDPHSLYISHHDNGRFTITAETNSNGNRRVRIARMLAISRRIKWGKWRCHECGEQLPLCKRADARFCSERCRKASARQRRRPRVVRLARISHHG